MDETGLVSHLHTLNGKRVRVLQAGKDNPPILLLHGGGLDHAMLSWRKTIPVLAANRRVIAPDWPGYGDSEGFDQPYEVADLVAWLVRLLDLLGVEQVDCVGLSMGGGAALGLALAHPQRVRCIVPVGSYGLQRKLQAHQISWLLTRMPWITKMTYRTMRGSATMTRRFLASVIANPGRSDDLLVAEVMEVVQQPDTGRAFALFQEREVEWSRLRTCYLDRLGEITAPTLFLHGRRDGLVPLSLAQEAASRVPGATLKTLDAGHWPMRECPAEFNDLLLAFLQEDSDLYGHT